MEAKKRNILIVILALTVLACATAVLAFINKPAETAVSGSVAIKSGGETVRTYTMDDLMVLDCVEVQKEIVSSSFANDEGLFRGVALRVLLADAGIDLESSSQIIVRAEDGFVSAFPADEITESDGIFLAFSKNGEGLGSLDSGGSGPFRIIVSDDPFGNRCAKYVCEIEVK